MKPDAVLAAAAKGLTRRNLLIAAGAGTGLAIGWAVWPRRRALNWTAAKGEQVINAFLKIGADGRVVVAVPQAEMGQGIWSGLAQIAADELGADWRAVSVEPAPLGPQYANHGMAADALAGMAPAMQAIAGAVSTRLIEYFDFQITGGSTSVRGFEAPLRSAAAAAREMLCRAAARRWDVDWQECDTVSSHVVYKANRIAFAAIAADAAAQDAPDTPTLRTKRTLAGLPVLRLDIPSKTDGSARFGIDVRLPGLLFAAIAQGPIGGIRAATDRKRLPPGVRLVEMPDFVAVVAPGWWQAKSALDALDLQWKPGKNAPGPWLQAAVKGALQAKDGSAFGPAGRIGTVAHEAGDVGTAMAGGKVITADYSLPFLAHACLEPMTATARISDGRAEIWAPTQSASLVNWAVARALDMAEGDVAVFPTLLGGGFGRKVETDACVQAALIAREVGQPVQLIWSREEDQSHDMYRPAVAARLHGKAGPRGITAWNAAVAVPDVGAGFTGRNMPALPSSPAEGGGAIEGAVPPYAIADLRVAHCLADCTAPLGFWRSVGHSFTGFVVECFVDELAHAAGADPGAFRLAMLAGKPRHAAVLRAALAAGGPLGQVQPGLGRGVALVESFGSIVAQVAEVLVEGGRPRVTRVWAAIDCGRVINPDSVRAQIEGGIVYGLTAALHGGIDFAGGAVAQTNFDSYPLLTMADCPIIETIIMPSNEAPGGVGEPGTPPIAPAVANALFAATNVRFRDLPLIKA
ncbi:molybdopterin cofactor-binding domain-containing protein [Sandarakinorhabdus sp.]|uniref:xanthine dehydrogenase family protein molybdopterin-binding subunit n=1 Tax=Sandarakinorhabdus sp. TaxID=1916663 RepID=UPI00286DF170|nr:molybdopterin cofactor-binding domain-containing protein [Sandarakinorhabdus sp.]